MAARPTATGPEEIAAAKRRLRAEILARRRGVRAEDARVAGERIARWALECPGVARAQRIALFAGVSGEPDTRPLFEALGPGRVRLLPRLVAGAPGLVFAELQRWDDLRRGRYGLLEPPAGAREVQPGSGDLVLVPGVGFDRAGHRLGRGGGYYDRTFGGEPRPILIGVGYTWQIVETLPHTASDVRMDAILTDAGGQCVSARSGSRHG